MYEYGSGKAKRPLPYARSTGKLVNMLIDGITKASLWLRARWFFVLFCFGLVWLVD